MNNGAKKAGGRASEDETLAHLPKMFRAMRHPDFMRHGRPEDYGELRELRKYMLDTDICVYLVDGSVEEVRSRFAKLKPGEAVMSALTLAELRYGVIRLDSAAKRDAANRGLAKILTQAPALPFDEDAALAYARVRAVDPKRNIRAMDKLIAAHAVALGLVLVTNNPKDFRKFRPALRVENWAAGKR